MGHHYPAAWKRQGRVFDDAVVGGTNLEDKGPLGGDIAGSRISESRNRNTRQEPERQHCAITHHRGYVGTGYGICMVGKGSCRAALVNFEQASSPMSTNCFSLLKTLLGRFSILRNEPISPQTYIKAHQSRCKSTLRIRLRSILTQLSPTLLSSPCSPHPAPLTLLHLVSPLHSHPSHAPSNKSSRHPVISLLVSLVPVLTCSQGTKTLVLVVSVLVHVLYLNLDVQRPITSPWHTSSALNSDPSSVR